MTHILRPTRLAIRLPHPRRQRPLHFRGGDITDVKKAAGSVLRGGSFDFHGPAALGAHLTLPPARPDHAAGMPPNFGSYFVSETAGSKVLVPSRRVAFKRNGRFAGGPTSVDAVSANETATMPL